VRHGKTPVLTEEQASSRLLESIDTSSVVGLRDRALIGVMTYSKAVLGRVCSLFSSIICFYRVNTALALKSFYFLNS
jgi:hypothetical protein